MGYQPPPLKNTTSSFLPSLPPYICKLSKPPFLSNPSSTLVSREPSLKKRFFSEPPKYWSFSFLTPSYLLKVTKFLVEISQFEFLVMTEKNIFAHKLFLPLNIQILIFWFIFMWKLQPLHLNKVTPSFPANPLQKLRFCQAAPPFENLVGGSSLQQKGVGAHYDCLTNLNACS